MATLHADPFHCPNTGRKKVSDLDRKIIAAELPGVLAWAVRGTVDWMNEGLRVPQAIKAIVAEYRDDTDILGEWLTERTERDPDAMVTVGEAFTDYTAFCRESCMSAGSNMSFGRAMTDRGFKRARDAKIRRFVGFRLQPEYGPLTDAELGDPEVENLI